jgi:hypothetical protein
MLVFAEDADRGGHNTGYFVMNESEPSAVDSGGCYPDATGPLGYAGGRHFPSGAYRGYGK